jgi:hypothetical protein
MNDLKGLQSMERLPRLEIPKSLGGPMSTIAFGKKPVQNTVHWGTPETRHKRGYRTLRIPESVLHRVHRKRELRLG